MWILVVWGVIGCEIPSAPADPWTDVGERRAPLLVSLAPGLVTGVTSTYTVSGADPGETVSLVGSVDGVGAGPCPAKLGGTCLGVLAPRQLGAVTADAAGAASFLVTAPAVVGTEFATQAFVVRGAGGVSTIRSRVRVDEVFAPWVSGLASRPPNPTCVAPADPPSFDASAAVVQAFPALSFTTTTTAMVQPPGDPDHWWIAEQTGTIFRFEDRDDVTVKDTVVDITDLVVLDSNEQGLLGFTFHPDFATNGLAFLFYNTKVGNADRIEIVRYASLDGGLTLDRGTAEVLLSLEPYRNIHSGGHLAFGPDGFLYIGIGDTGKNASENGQDTMVLLGKMLRIDVDGGVPYAIPADNPYADGVFGEPEIYAIGIRQPWRWSFDRVTGDLWLGDVGADTREEVTVVERGGNHGWDLMEGTWCVSLPDCSVIPDLVEPVLDYGHLGSTAVIGGYVYRGTKIPALVGTYVFADHFTHELWGITENDVGEAITFDIAIGVTFQPSSFAEDADGELYMLARDGGVFRVEPAGPPPVIDAFPAWLSETGCVDPSDPTVPVEAMIPYEVNSPLWSDGATKQRWLAIPDGTTIGVGPDGDFEFPVGTVLVKEFTAGGRRVETRLLLRHDDGTWAGYAYAWLEDDSDAFLVDDALDVVDGTPPDGWRIPSRGECLQCHTDVAGFDLGLTIGQLNGDLTYPSTGITANQLVTLDQTGFFTELLANTPDQLAALADPSTAPPVSGARSYLAANCAHCHQPGGPGLGDLDFRITTKDPGGCDELPTQGDLGVLDARVIAPGDASRSVVSLRMHATDGTRMPPVATEVVDPVGTAVVDAWIDGLTGCPP
jgi:uncharacterized repeat protein (TIGR03806 family)